MKAPLTKKARLVAVSLMAGVLFVLLAACSDGNATEIAGEYPIPQDPALISAGISLYKTNCTHCHGTGTTPPITINTPSHASDGHTWHHPDQFLASWILDGVPGGVTMPRFRGQLTEDEVRAIIAYIKTFWTDTQRQQQQQMSANYEANYR